MRRSESENYHEIERKMIDALLKISEIVKKSEAHRSRQKPIDEIVGDGDKNECSPINRTMKKFQPEGSVTNFNRTSTSQSKKNLVDSEQNSTLSSSKSKKILSTLNEKLETNETLQSCHSSQSQTMSYRVNSISTTLPDDRTTSLTMIPIVSDPIVVRSQQEIKVDSKQGQSEIDSFVDKKLRNTLERRLKSDVEPSKKRARTVDLSESQTKNLIDRTDFVDNRSNSTFYEEQRRLAISAAKEDNFALSHAIYTNLLNDPRFDCRTKSEILASRGTTLLLEEKYFESIDDCTRAIGFNQWNKLAFVVRAACWMIVREYRKAVDDYSKLFHFFDRTQQVLDLLNLAFDKSQTHSNSMVQVQPAVYLCYPYQNSTVDQVEENCQRTKTRVLSHPSLITDRANKTHLNDH